MSKSSSTLWLAIDFIHDLDLLHRIMEKYPPMPLKPLGNIAGIDEKTLNVGDHIMIQRKFKDSNISYYHHGIVSQIFPYLMVIHPHKTLNTIPGNSLLSKLQWITQKDMLSETPYADFIDNTGYFENYVVEKAIYGVSKNVVNTCYKYPKQPNTNIVTFARHLMENKCPYNACNFNCETFAVMCSTGIQNIESIQTKYFRYWCFKHCGILRKFLTISTLLLSFGIRLPTNPRYLADNLRDDNFSVLTESEMEEIAEYMKHHPITLHTQHK